MYLNDLEEELATKGLAGIDIGIHVVNIYLILYADDIILFGKKIRWLKESLSDIHVRGLL